MNVFNPQSKSDRNYIKKLQKKKKFVYSLDKKDLFEQLKQYDIQNYPTLHSPFGREVQRQASRLIRSSILLVVRCQFAAGGNETD